MKKARDKRVTRILVVSISLAVLGFSIFYIKRVQSEDLNTIRSQVNQVASQREALESEVTAFDVQIKFLLDQVAELEKNIAEMQSQIDMQETELKKQKSFLSEYLSTMYIEGQTSMTELILASNSFSDFVNRNEYRNIIQGELKDIVDRITEIKEELEEKKKALSEEKAKLDAAKASAEKQKAEKETALTQVKEEERILRKKFAERLRSAGVSPYCKGSGAAIKAKYPVFSFPVNCGYISQGYGMTEFAELDNAYRGAIHNGVDVGVGTGTETRSIGKGVVYAKGASPSGGWGNWIMIKHDKVRIENKDYEFYSLYGHMVSETYLNVGERIDGSTIVGWVGGTPYWAPHLHFSLFLSNSGWSNGNPGAYPGNTIDPLNYMDIPISTSGTDWDPNFTH